MKKSNLLNNKQFRLVIGLTVLIIVCGLAASILFVKAFLVYGQPSRVITSSSLPAQLLWQIQIDEPVNKRPVLAENQVIISTSEAIYGLDITTGQQTWKHVPDEQPSITPIVTANKVIYGNRIGQLCAIDVTTGEVVWCKEMGLTSRINSIDFNDKMVYFSTTPSTIIGAVDLDTGETSWEITGSQHNIPNRGANIFFVNDEIYVFTTETHILEAKTGQVKQTLPQDFTPAQLVNNRFYTSRSVYEANTLELITELSSPSYRFLQGGCESFRTPYAFSENTYYAAGRCGGVYALDIESNQIKWSYREDVSGESPMAIYRNQLYVLFDDGEIHAIDVQTGQRQGVLKTNHGIPGSVRNASFLSRGLVANANVLVATFNDKNVWAFCEQPCLFTTEMGE